MNKDFRGLFLADHQEAIGEKAFQCVDELNRTVLTKFKGLSGFNDAISRRKEISTFYKEELIPQIKAEKAQRLKTSQMSLGGATEHHRAQSMLTTPSYAIPRPPITANVSSIDMPLPAAESAPRSSSVLPQ